MKQDPKPKSSKTVGSPSPGPAIPSIGPEPTAGNATAPVWLFVVLGLLLYWSTMYLDQNGGTFSAQVYQPYRSLKFVEDLQPKSDTDELFARGKRVYEQIANCQACHQATGLGVAGQFPPLAGSEWVLAPGPARIIRVVLHGLNGPIQVKGSEYSNAMTPFGSVLTDDRDVAAVLTYIRQNKAWGNTGSGVTPEQVKAVRDATKDRVEPWTAAELLQIPEN
jgi:mono/diheme cytochrome c family protein